MVRVAVLRVPGTNCDRETARAIEEAGAEAFVLHVGQLERGEEDLMNYHGLVIPGGFSYGDRIRAGAVLAARLGSKLDEQIEEFAASNRPILGICNGFQVLVELGLLPGFEGCRAALAPNESAHFECRWVWLKKTGSCDLAIGPPLQAMPIAHSEGRLVFSSPSCLEKAGSAGLIVYRYAKPDGSSADGEYPYNPNGSQGDVAALCNPSRMIMGIMPHPERAIYNWQTPLQLRPPAGLGIFRALISAAERSL